jgi:hypothetical protein
MHDKAVFYRVSAGFISSLELERRARLQSSVLADCDSMRMFSRDGCRTMFIRSDHTHAGLRFCFVALL